MLQFHFCQKYRDKVSSEVDKMVRNRISNLSVRETLKGVSGIFSYSGVYVLQTNSPLPMRTIIQESKIAINGDHKSVLFVQDIVEIDDLQPYTEVRRGLWSQYYPVLESDKNDYVIDFQEIREPKSNKPELPDSLVSWLEDFKIQISYDIYESEQWVTFALGNGNGMQQSDLTAFRNLILSAFENSGSVELLGMHNEIRVEVLIERGLGIVYSKIPINGGSVFLLQGGAYINRQNEKWEGMKKKALAEINTLSNMDEIGKKSNRAYPSWVLNDTDSPLWQNIQRISDTGNFALLTEQTNYLRDFKFPSYIDGQAGSGKSTMLYYLFANVYYYKCLGEIKGDIIFLTENKNLLESTKRSIRDLLQNNPTFNLTDEYITTLDSQFSTLKDFLISQLTEDEDKALFHPDKYLDFPRFKNLYEEKLQIKQSVKSKYSAEFLWFILTTYVRGYDLDFQMTSVNYDEKMPKEGKELISKEQLSDIEKNILPFYSILLQDYWDKIKIISYIKKNPAYRKNYEVIFCDEAQDFSPIELQFILGLSNYLQYDWSKLKYINQGIPVVFAGDPFQTVNPTGFRKANVKDLFFYNLDKKLNENEYKPVYNYRSSQAIVNLSNAIQYFRDKQFGISIGKPQQTRRPQQTSDEYLDKFISFDALSENIDDYVNQLEYKTIIIPVNRNEKEEYVGKNEFLYKFTDHHKNKSIDYQNGIDLLRSPVEAKGVDYPQVVIYGFGEYCIGRFGSISSIANNYDARFFFNKLYVAVTRAQEELIIIDSEESFNLFWKELLIRYADDTEWSSNSGVDGDAIKQSICRAENSSTIKPGTPDLELVAAGREREQASYTNDADLMQLAASRFAKLGKYKEYYMCKAEESLIRGSWDKAVEYYRNKAVGIEGRELAADVYWRQGDVKEYVNLVSAPKNAEQNIRRIISDLIQNGRLSHEDIREMAKNKSDASRIISALAWKDEIIVKLIGVAEQVTDVELQGAMLNLFDTLNQTLHRADLYWQTGRLQYSLKRFSEAISTLSRIDRIEDKPLYIKAQIEVNRASKKYDKLIIWLGKFWDVENEMQKEVKEEIIIAYRFYQSEINQGDTLAIFYVLKSYLLQDAFNSGYVLEVSRQLEERLVQKRTVLIDYYYSLMEEKQMSNILHGFVLDRWVKNKSLAGASLETINKEYLQLLDVDVLKYPFSQREIDAIPSLPSDVTPPLPEHITNITVRNFRKFKEVSIEDIGGFSLIVGDNNIGKTSLLEMFLFTPNVEAYLKRLAFAFIERKNIIPDKDDVNGILQSYYTLDENFLNDYKNQDEPVFDIEFKFTEGRKTWKYNVVADDANKTYSEETLDLKTGYNLLNKLPFSDLMSQPFMPYGKGFGSDLADVYINEISSSRKTEQEFINALQLFVPNIDLIKVDNKRGEIFILEKENDDYIPLHRFGEGANKIFRILLLLTLHKGKRVMIDEIDAGIHYSRFKDFWKIILKEAQQNNTQIIATTHNGECITFFTEALRELGDEYIEKARVIACEVVSQKLWIDSYDFKNFNLAEERGVELRGGRGL